MKIRYADHIEDLTKTIDAGMEMLTMIKSHDPRCSGYSEYYLACLVRHLEYGIAKSERIVRILNNIKRVNTNTISGAYGRRRTHMVNKGERHE